MAGSEDSARRPAGKRSPRRPQRFSFERVDGIEPESRLPDLSRGEVGIEPLSEGQERLVINTISKNWDIKVPTTKILASAGIDDLVIRSIAERFQISNVQLLRVVLALCAHESQESKDYMVSCSGQLEVGVDAEQYDLIRKSDDSSEELENILQELLSKKDNKHNNLASLLNQRETVSHLMEALRAYSNVLGNLTITEHRRTAVRPVLGRERRLVGTLAAAWAKLTGENLSPWNMNFYKFMKEVCGLVGIKPAPTPQSVATWLKGKFPRNQNKPSGDDE